MFKNINRLDKKKLIIIVNILAVLCIIVTSILFVFRNKIWSKPEVSELNSSSSDDQFSSSLDDNSSQSSKQEIDQNFSKSDSADISSQKALDVPNLTQKTTDGFKEFSGPQFRDFYETIKYPKVTNTDIPSAITGNSSVDTKIQGLAENRGYKLRPQALEKELVSVNGQRLQIEAKNSWLELQANAKKDGLNLVLVSGYRSIADQKSLFIGDLRATGFGNQDILNGLADSAIDEILQTRSIPGYSRHHTGFTFDLGCNSSDLVNFKTTACYDWISKDNYYQAKKAGLIPSYPAGVTTQGPNPEEWEYVWVGIDSLK